MKNYTLTKNQKCLALNLAMQVECGLVEPRKVIKAFNSDPLIARSIIDFWKEFDSMTRNALSIVIDYVQREHLENCLYQTATNFSDLEM